MDFGLFLIFAFSQKDKCCLQCHLNVNASKGTAVFNCGFILRNVDLRWRLFCFYRKIRETLPRWKRGMRKTWCGRPPPVPPNAPRPHPHPSPSPKPHPLSPPSPSPPTPTWVATKYLRRSNCLLTRTTVLQRLTQRARRRGRSMVSGVA